MTTTITQTDALHTHLQTGSTTVARAWYIERRDGIGLGFTDHDVDLSFDNMLFRAAAGMTAKVLHQTSGLAVDNTEALGVLVDDRISEQDINAGLYDLASVQSWLVNWQNPDERKLIFKGSVGEIRRQGHAFDAELRGLTEALNQVQGRVYQHQCTSIVGDDTGCGVNLDDPQFHMRAGVLQVPDRHSIVLDAAGDFAAGWFTRGRMTIETGAGASVVAWIKQDTIENGTRVVQLWEDLRANLQLGDQILLHAGCDKTPGTCKAKFGNLLNFQGFPFIPGEDWLVSVPIRAGQNDGGALV